MFSKACEYGIRASIYIASKSQDGERVSLKEIAKEIDSPVAFTAKILQLLSKNGIVESVKGAAGGFEINKGRISQIRFEDIVSAIDGNKVYEGCGLGLTKCNENKPCPAHDRFVAIRNDLKEMLVSTNLYEMTIGLETGHTYLKR